jgi:hypothetical protein
LRNQKKPLWRELRNNRRNNHAAHLTGPDRPPARPTTTALGKTEGEWLARRPTLSSKSRRRRKRTGCPIGTRFRGFAFGFGAVSSRFHRGFAWFRLMVSEGVGETMFFSMISMGETIRNHAYFGGLRFFVPQSCRATCHAGSCMAA